MFWGMGDLPTSPYSFDFGTSGVLPPIVLGGDSGEVPPDISGGGSAGGGLPRSGSIFEQIGNAVANVARSITGNYPPQQTVYQASSQPQTQFQPQAQNNLSLDKGLSGLTNFVKQNLLLVVVIGGGFMLYKSGRK